jgi:hypothetical protein
LMIIIKVCFCIYASDLLSNKTVFKHSLEKENSNDTNRYVIRWLLNCRNGLVRARNWQK